MFQIGIPSIVDYLFIINQDKIMSELAKKLIEKEKKERTGYLDLGRCGLTEWLEELFECTWLETLILSNKYWDMGKHNWVESQNNERGNKLTNIPKNIQNLKQLHTLIVGGDYQSGWNIKDLADLFALKNLRNLNLGHNQIRDISVLEELVNIQNLYLSNNRIRNIKPLENLTNIQILYLRDNAILDISALEKLTGIERLYLSNNHVSDIDVLKKMNRIKSLNINNNLLEDISVLEKLTNIQKLRLDNNLLKDISVLEKLTNIQSLDLSNNQLSDITALGKLTNIKRLYLDNNPLKDISVLGELVNIKHLCLNDNKLGSVDVLRKLININTLHVRNAALNDISALKELTNVRNLDLSGNRLRDINALERMTSIRNLSLSHNQIINLWVLEKMTNIQNLDLSNNQLSNIDALKNLINVEYLNLKNNQLTDISALEKLVKIQDLNVGHNYIENIVELKGLTNIRFLHMSANRLSSVRPLEKLINIQILYLTDNRLSDIKPLEKLTNILALYLSNNPLRDISPLEKLTNIQTLYLSNNRLNDINPLGGLINIQNLHLASTHLSNIDVLEKLTNIQYLHLSNNQIEDLTPLLPLIKKGISVKWHKTSSGICVYDNPLKIPTPEIIQQGPKAVRRYFQDLEKQGINNLYEAKLLIVGDGESGKTTLAWKLKDINAKMPEKDNDRTRGIDIEPLHIDNINQKDQPFRMNVWDFGGQEIYHATHQFFLTKRSLYLLLNNTRSNLTDFNHWCQTISLFSNDSPIIIVQNEVDGSDTRLDLRGLQQHFSNILYVRDADLSITTDGRLEKLIRDIKIEIQRLGHIGSPLPKQWASVRKELEKRAKQAPYIYDVEFSQICRRNKITEKEAMRRLGSFLHDLGVFLHFQDDPVLKRIVILQNSWATKGVYKILDNKAIRDVQKGHFSYLDAQAIWEGTPFEDMHDELLQLMAKFELCYKVENGKKSVQYVSPQLLPVEKPDYQWDIHQNLVIYYDYAFMPKGLLSRLVVRLHDYIKDVDKYAWRAGCVFVYEDTEGQVLETYGDKKLEIRIKGSHCAGLATIIMKEIDELNGSFERIHVDKLIQCTCEECKTSKAPYFFNYETLKRRKARGKKRYIECLKSEEDVPVNQLLDGIFEHTVANQYDVRKYLSQGKIRETLKVFANLNPEQATQLQLRYERGLSYYNLGLTTLENWEVLQNQISAAIQYLAEHPDSKVLPLINEEALSQQLHHIEQKLNKQERHFAQLFVKLDQYLEDVQTAVAQLESQTLPIGFAERILRTVEERMTEFEAQIPQAADIIVTWQATQAAIKSTTDSKAKLKFVLPFLIGKLEKEFSLDTKGWFKPLGKDPWFRSILEDIRQLGEGKV